MPCHRRCSTTLCLALLLAGCAADPSRPNDAALNCQQISDEIAAQERTSNTSEAQARELRPGYYAVQGIGLVPYVGDAVGLVDMVADISRGRELDKLNETTDTARGRRDYLMKMQTARCGPGPASAPVR